jgi:hypothetical protein
VADTLTSQFRDQQTWSSWARGEVAKVAFAPRHFWIESAWFVKFCVRFRKAGSEEGLPVIRIQFVSDISWPANWTNWTTLPERPMATSASIVVVWIGGGWGWDSGLNRRRQGKAGKAGRTFASLSASATLVRISYDQRLSI